VCTSCAQPCARPHLCAHPAPPPAAARSSPSLPRPNHHRRPCRQMEKLSAEDRRRPPSTSAGPEVASGLSGGPRRHPCPQPQPGPARVGRRLGGRRRSPSARGPDRCAPSAERDRTRPAGGLPRAVPRRPWSRGGGGGLRWTRRPTAPFDIGPRARPGSSPHEMRQDCSPRYGMGPTGLWPYPSGRATVSQSRHLDVARPGGDPGRGTWVRRRGLWRRGAASSRGDRAGRAETPSSAFARHAGGDRRRRRRRRWGGGDRRRAEHLRSRVAGPRPVHRAPDGEPGFLGGAAGDPAGVTSDTAGPPAASARRGRRTDRRADRDRGREARWAPSPAWATGRRRAHPLTGPRARARPDGPHHHAATPNRTPGRAPGRPDGTPRPGPGPGRTACPGPGPRGAIGRRSTQHRPAPHARHPHARHPHARRGR